MDRFLLSCVVVLVMLALAPAASAMLVDPVAVSARACSITGTGGADRLDGTRGEDRICGRGGADRVRAGNAADVLLGGGGGDLLEGKKGRDRLDGGGGPDRLFGGAGADDLRGGAGPDSLGGGLGPDLMSGGSGRDVAVYGQRVRALRISIGGGADDGNAGERDNVRGDVEEVRGGRGNDVLVGNARGNRLFGGAGNDRLRGRGGSDILSGEAGDDRIDARERAGSTGGAAQTGAVDRVVCGDGQDTAFVDPSDAVDADCENVIGGSSGTPPALPPTPAPPRPAAPNRAPVAAAATLETAEDTPAAVTLAGSDPDGDSLSFAIASPPAHGTLTGSGATRTYRPAADYVGADGFRFSVSDGRGGSATATVAITVTAVNDAPRLSATTVAASFTEGAGPIVVDGALTVTDVDDSQLTGATVTITSGLNPADDELAFPPAAGITGVYDAPSGTLTLTGTATVAEYQAALRTVTFNSPGANPTADTRTVSFAADDGDEESAAASRDVAMTVVNDAPVLTVSAGSASHTEGAADTVVDPGLQVADLDSPDMAGATVEITGGLAAGDALLFTAQNGITGNFAGGTLTLTGAATRAQYETALRSVRYRTTSDDPSTADRSVTFVVDDGADESAPVTRDVSVVATNDAASVTTSAGPVSFTEQAAPMTVDDSLTVADPDNAQLAGARVEITAGLDPADTLAFTPAGAITGTYSNGALVLSGTGTVAEYQAALRSVTFTTAGDDPSTTARTIAFSVDDGGGLGPAGERGLTVIAVNDAPVLGGVGGSAAYTENGAGSAVAPALTVADPDDAQLNGATVSITAGFDPADLLLFDDQNGITGSFTGGTLTLTGAATVDEYRDALRSVRFATAGEAPSTATRTVSFVVEDGTDESAAVTRDVTVTAVNDAPTVATSAGSLTFTEGGGPVAIDPAVGLTDPDSTQITGATVTISANYAGAQDVLAFTDTLTITGSVSGNTLTLTGTDTLVSYVAALRSVTFENTSNAPSTLPREITFAVTDAEGGTGSGTRNLTVVGVNSAPVLAPATGAVAFTENDPSIAVAPAITVTDGDSTQIQGATVQITSNFAAGQDVLTFTPSGAVTGSQTGDTLTLGGADSLATYQTVLRSVRYENSSDTPSTLTRTLTFTATDSDGAASNAATRDVTVAATNDSPTITTSAGAVSYVENAAALTVDAGLQVSDPDSTTATGATVRIAGAVSGDMLELTDVPGIADSFAGDTLTLTGSATLAAYQAALRAVTFRSTSENPTNANRTIEFTITDDGAATSAAAARTVQVTAVNDAPTIDPTDAAASALEQTATAVDADIVISDADSANLTGASVQITGNFQAGQDTLQFTNQNGITGGFAAGTLTLTGTATVAQYQTALRSVTYTNTSDTPATATRTITFRVTDDGTPGLQSAAQTRDLTVVPVNDAPTDSGESQTATANTRLEVELTFGGSTNPKRTSATGNLLDNAADVDDAAAALSVDTATVSDPANGAVSVNADGSYVYTPDVGFTGADSFTYRVKDDENAQSSLSTVSITVANRVWYVRADAAAGGDGRSETPFNTLTAADTAATASGDTIYVFRKAGDAGTVSDTSVDLLANQRLLGSAVDLTDGVVTLYTGGAGLQPSLTTTSVKLDDANTIRGLAVSGAGSGAEAIEAGSGDAGGTLDQLSVAGNSGGIELANGAGGTWNLSDLTVTTTGGDAIAAANAGTVNFTPAGTISIAAAAGRGLNLSGTTTSGTVDSTTVTSSPNDGIRLDDNPGSLTLNDINLTTTGTGIDIDSSNDVTVSGGDADITSGGPAVNLTTITSNPANPPDLTLDQVTSTGGANGINIDDIGAGTFTAAGGTLSGHTAAEIDINAGSGNITYPGTINNGSGLSAQITGRTGGTVTLAGNINDTNDAGGGIDMAANAGGTFTFSGTTKKLDTGAGAAFSSSGTNPTINLTGGGVDIDTTSGTGFNATGGGTITVQGPSNSVSTTTGTAVNVANTSIGTAGMTFGSVSANGASNGIALNNTGGAGRFIVTGDGDGNPDGGGGTITNSTSHALNLVNTLSPSLTDMTVSNAGNADNEYGLHLTNVSGTVTLDDMTFNNAADNLVYLNSTTSSTINVTGSVFTYPATVSATANSALLLEPGGAANLTASITGTTFTNVFNASTQIGANTAAASGTLSLTFANNTINSATGRAGGVVVSGQELTTTSLSITNNTFTGAGGNGVISIDTNDSSTVTGTIAGNVISNPPGIGIFSAVDEAATSTLTFNNNTVTNAGGDGLQFVNFGGAGSSTMNATVTNNTVNGHSLNTAVSFVGGISVTGFEEVMDLQLTGNTVTGTPASGTQCGGAPCVDYYLEEVGGTFRLEEIPDTQATTASAAFVNATNDAGPVTIFGTIDLSNGVEISGS